MHFKCYLDIRASRSAASCKPEKMLSATCAGNCAGRQCDAFQIGGDYWV